MIHVLVTVILVVANAVCWYLLGRYHGARAALRRITEHNQRVAYERCEEGS